MQLGTGESLAKHWGLTPNEWVALQNMPVFVDMVRRATEETASPDGLIEKIRRKAALAVDSGVVDVVSIMVSNTTSASLRLQAFGELRELAGLTKNAVAPNAGVPAGPIIQINFADASSTKTITVGADVPQVEGPSA